MKESDWKVFTAIKDKAIEQYCTVALEETQEVVSDHKKHVHERYLFLYKLLQNSNKKMALLFDGHSRSKAWIQLIAIRSEGLADEVLLSKLSDEFRDETDPEKHGW
ncbi:hypothetical protein H4J57_19180 [Colwellia sp. BRX8-7]|jgi:hypothetical protein|uniref:hypothetical protein n=1 Tax=unclassified Colwellia TaxID=196834 RepID=UPI0015F6B7D4|nr:MULTISPECIES: hypothetical protein [unclassified Colwellia]MBA6339312.1 hypothetical protein [Colwellia sp. BRX8-7]MBA6354227.1 hypothetical protein [Colwellia sp. BRX9-1]